MARELITVDGVDRSFGPVDVLKDVGFTVMDGDRIGIVGHNGAGKTTLLNTISEQRQDVGDIDLAPGLRMAYLTQIRDLEDGKTIEEELSRKGRQFVELEEEIAEIEARMVDPAFYEGDWQPVMDRYAELQQTLASSGGANVLGIAKAILERLGLDEHPMDLPVTSLSGGASQARTRSSTGGAGRRRRPLPRRADEPSRHPDDGMVGSLPEGVPGCATHRQP